MDLRKAGTSKNPEITDLATNRIFYHTCQILQQGGEAGYRPLGSGVLVKVFDNYYLFTASHVAATKDGEELYVLTKRGIRTIIGEARESDLEVNSKIDVAYIRLHPQFVELLKESYEFLPQNRILLNHFTNDSTFYLAYGYPAVNIKVDAENRMVRVGSEFYLLKPSKEKVYKRYGLDEQAHFILDFAGKGTSLFTDEKIKVNSEPYGISGGGLWALKQTQNIENPLDYALIGLLIEYRKGQYHILIANRIDIVVQGINADRNAKG